MRPDCRRRLPRLRRQRPRRSSHALPRRRPGPRDRHPGGRRGAGRPGDQLLAEPARRRTSIAGAAGGTGRRLAGPVGLVLPEHPELLVPAAGADLRRPRAGRLPPPRRGDRALPELCRADQCAGPARHGGHPGQRGKRRLHRGNQPGPLAGAERGPRERRLPASRAIPPAAVGLPGHIRQLHSHDYRNPQQLPGGAVLVVGTGQSGGQITEDLLDAGRDRPPRPSQPAPRRPGATAARTCSTGSCSSTSTAPSTASTACRRTSSPPPPRALCATR